MDTPASMGTDHTESGLDGVQLRHPGCQCADDDSVDKDSTPEMTLPHVDSMLLLKEKQGQEGQQQGSAPQDGVDTKAERVIGDAKVDAYL